MSVIVCVPLDPDGSVGARWGKAARLALASVDAAGIEDWQEHDVGWDALHDAGGEGVHHARVARFLRDHGVEVVVARHMGPPMEHMLGKLGVDVRLGAAGDAREAVLTAVAG